jgi:hypothetical protein
MDDMDLADIMEVASDEEDDYMEDTELSELRNVISDCVL